MQKFTDYNTHTLALLGFKAGGENVNNRVKNSQPSMYPEIEAHARETIVHGAPRRQNALAL